MNMTEDNSLSAKTWARAADSIIKAGYMDGAAQGQAEAFQSSFDIGYKEGFSFGFSLGLKEANNRSQQIVEEILINDPRKINCQICLNSDLAQKKVGDLVNIQKQKNEEYLCVNE